jgi:uncharacterized protein (TIGR02271 family)
MTDEQEVAAIPLVEEQVVIEKQEVETGRHRIRVSVEERQEMVPVELARDEVEIERVPVNRPVTQLPSVRLEGSTTIIPVVEEVVVMEKRLVLVEEIHVRRKSGTTTQNIPVMLRSEQADIERTGFADSSAGVDEPTGEGRVKA